MKNILVTVPLILISVSCSDNLSDPNDESLIGTWDLNGMTSETGGETHTIPPEEIEADPLTYTLKEDSTGIQYYKGKTSEFHWEASQNTLVFSTYNEIHTYTFTVNAENLKLTFPISQYTITHIFQRR